MTTTAKDYFKAADGHRKAVELLRPHEFRGDGSRDSVFFALYNVLGFCVELYLKAFLSKVGMDEKNLRSKKYGHNLENLLDEAIKRGFDVRLADMKAILKHLGSGHGEYTYRYVQDGGMLGMFNDLSPVIEALKAVHISMQDDLA